MENCADPHIHVYFFAAPFFIFQDYVNTFFQGISPQIFCGPPPPFLSICYLFFTGTGGHLSLMAGGQFFLVGAQKKIGQNFWSPHKTDGPPSGRKL